MSIRPYSVLVLSWAMVLASGVASSAVLIDGEHMSPTGVQYSVMSQRWLTTEELSQFDDVKDIVLGVRLRLTNRGKDHILYLATSGTIVPTGYHLFRAVGASEWKSTSASRGREGPPGSEFTGTLYSWLELPPGASIEVDAHDWSKPGEEHAFSTLVKSDPTAKPIEIISDSFRPLVK